MQRTSVAGVPETSLQDTDRRVNIEYLYSADLKLTTTRKGGHGEAQTGSRHFPGLWNTRWCPETSAQLRPQRAPRLSDALVEGKIAL